MDTPKHQTPRRRAGRVAVAVAALLLASLATVSTASAESTTDPGAEPTTSVDATLSATTPGAPSDVRAKALGAGAVVTWTAPDDGGSPITGYLVSTHSHEGTRTLNYPPGEHAQVLGLRPGTSYFFTVTAQNAHGDGPESSSSNKVIPTPRPPKLDGASYVPIAPCRIVDTREAGGPLDNREIRDYQVRGNGEAFIHQGGKADGCGIRGDALAIEASVTAVSPADSGFFRAWPSNLSMPNATFMNFDRGMDITNTGAITLAVEEPSDGAEVTTNAPRQDLRVRNFGGSAQYVIDIQGYFIPVNNGSPQVQASGEEPPPAIFYTPITPCRIVDTRIAGGPLGNREIRDFQVTGQSEAFSEQGGTGNGCNIPEGSTAAVEASVTAVSPTDSGFFRAWPSGLAMPNATFMNFDQGMDITNTGAITIDGRAKGQMRVRNFGGAAQYVVDIQGYYSPFDLKQEIVASGNGGEKIVPATYIPIKPCRIVDTRGTAGPFGNREIRDYQAIDGDPVGAIEAQGGNPAGCDIPLEAKAIEASITAVSPADSGFFRAWPSGQSMPNATFMNFDRGMDITNTGAITIDRDFVGESGALLSAEAVAQLRARNFGGSAEYVIDVQGYFLPIVNPA